MAKRAPTNGKATTVANEERLTMQEQDRLDALVSNAFSTRQKLVNAWLDPRRDINDECGYPPLGEITADNYWELFEREAVAARVVEVWPLESWQATPTVYEDEDPDTETDFELAWDEVARKLNGTSFYKQEEGNPIWEYLRRADILSGIGHYGVLLIGIDDGEANLSMPVKGFEKGIPEKPVGKDRKLIYLRAFDESNAQITAYEGDKLNPRYGQPTKYLLTLHDPKDSINATTPAASTVEVHWSRVIHIADNLNSSDILGVPRMRPVYNRLLDLRKLYSGSAEMYWRGAFPGISLETHPTLGGDVQIDKTAARAMMERYMNSLQRYLLAEGTTVKTLAPVVSDPGSQIDKQIDAICIKLTIPKRIFMGSERGELASGQDDSTWNGRLKERQHNYLTPRVIIPLIDRLILLGVLPMPESYSVSWPDLDTLKPAEQAALAVQRTDAIVKYVSGGADVLIAPRDFLTVVVGFDEEEVDSILDNVVEHLTEANPDAEGDIIPGVAPKQPAPEFPPGAPGADPNAPPLPPGQKPPSGNQPPFGGKPNQPQQLGKKPPFGGKPNG